MPGPKLIACGILFFEGSNSSGEESICHIDLPARVLYAAPMCDPDYIAVLCSNEKLYKYSLTYETVAEEINFKNYFDSHGRFTSLDPHTVSYRKDGTFVFAISEGTAMVNAWLIDEASFKIRAYISNYHDMGEENHVILAQSTKNGQLGLYKYLYTKGLVAAAKEYLAYTP